MLGRAVENDIERLKGEIIALKLAIVALYATHPEQEKLLNCLTYMRSVESIVWKREGTNANIMFAYESALDGLHDRLRKNVADRRPPDDG